MLYQGLGLSGAGAESGGENIQSMISEVALALFTHPQPRHPSNQPPQSPHHPLPLAASLSFLLQRCHGDREMWEYLCPSESERETKREGRMRWNETEGMRKEERKEGGGRRCRGARGRGAYIPHWLSAH